MVDAALSRAIDALAKRARTPVATYRLQMHKDFPFAAAIQLLPYLSRLGVSDCYTSPLLKAGPGSKHGYDIVDHNQLNPELGTEMEYEAFAAALATNKLHHVLDFVPNHMGVYPDTNLWWKDVLENGPCSPFARYFDIDWHPIKPELRNKVLLPILGDQYGLVLERGELQLVYEQGSLLLEYYEKKIPINPTEVPTVLRHNIDALQAELKDDPSLREFLSILTELSNLPSDLSPDDKPRIEERRREKLVARDRLTRLVNDSPRIAAHIRSALEAFNGKPGDRRSFDALHRLLEAQYYRLASWRTASHEINYRRFFDVNQLGGVRMESREVFDATHTLVLRLLAEGKIRALRLDHPDGLFDPAAYFETLQQSFLETWIAAQLPNQKLSDGERHELTAWRGAEIAKGRFALGARPLYIVGEKILSTGEEMPAAWMLDGSSGYDFLNDLNRVFVDGKSAGFLRTFAGEFTAKRIPLDLVIYIGKRLIMTTAMASELNVLAHALNRISEENRRSRDFTLDSLRDALREVIACFPVYRTFISERECTAADRQIIDRAIQRARRRNPAVESSIFKFVREVLVPHDVAGLSDDERRRRLEFSMKFQQYTGPVQAKGLEDTAFYRYNVLLSLNEVGGDPARFGSSIKEFHDANQRRRDVWPHSMLATSTHDTKRGEDARARINVLSEIPERWQKKVLEWAQLNKGARVSSEEVQVPDPNDEYLYYQALLGAWPADPSTESREALAERMKAYMTKALREAKWRTSWIAPNEEYEKGVEHFVQDTLLGNAAKAFVPSFEEFVSEVARLGMINSLAQVALKACSPGVPDFYQGTELWDLSLVDPDNRRPVDYAKREEWLRAMDSLWTAPEAARVEALEKMLAEWPTGRVKLFLTSAVLRLRAAAPDLFLDGSYEPLEARGRFADHVIAFLRRHAGGAQPSSVLVVAPRWPSKLAGKAVGRESWQETTVQLPEAVAGYEWKNMLTSETVTPRRGGTALEVGALLSRFPVGAFFGQASAPADR